MSLKLPADFGRCLPRLKTAVPGPRSRALMARLRRVECINTTYSDAGFPTFWQAARCANVLDADGNCYIDLTSGFAVATLGHGDPGVVKAGTDQMRRLLHGLGDVHPTQVKVELLETLSALAPQPKNGPKNRRVRKIVWKTILASTGSEAVVTALKTAHRATGKPGIVAFEGGYHGLTLGALLATARPFFRQPALKQLADVTTFVPWPDPLRPARTVRRASPPNQIRDTALAQIEQVLRRGGKASQPAIGAIVVEPVQGRGGDRSPPAGFLRGLRSLASRYGALLIFDEIYCGMGRTGRLFATEAEGVIPDLYCLGKALGGGFPISACLGREEFIDAWGPSQGEAFHTSTFLGHPVGCAMALESLRRLSNPAFLLDVRNRGARFWENLRKRLQGVREVAEVRGIGWIGAIELVKDMETMTPDPARAIRVMLDCLRAGLVVLPCGDANNCISLTPPACITNAQLRYVENSLVTIMAKS